MYKLLSAKVLSTLLVVGAAGSIAGFGVFSAFSATTSNAGNTFAAGSVSIEDNDSNPTAVPLYVKTNQKPGVVTSSCIKVTYTGSLDSTVKLYAAGITAGGQYLNVTVTAGTQATSTFPDCAGFTATAGAPVFTGTLQSFQAAHTGFANGFTVNPANGTKWVQNDALVYRFEVSVQDSNAAQGAQSGTHTFTWEAQNQ